MSLRPPKAFARTANALAPTAFEVEAMAEAANSLGHRGRRVEAALKRLDAAEGEAREEALRAASREVWAFFVQRETCGLRDHRLVVREMGIPEAVLRRLGAA